jgi:hypothetical protein
MPEANTMETAKTELVESFIKYVTGVYLLQQEFIDDMQGGLQSVLEKYNVTSVNEQLDNVQETVEAVAPKKTRKKSTKKEQAEPTETVQENEPVTEAEAENEPVTEAEAEAEAEQENEPVTEAEQEVSIPSHVSSVLNTEEKKTRKPRAKKGETNEEPKKKRLTSAYNVFLTEYSKNPDLKGLKIGERKQLASPIWDKIKEDPERFKEYQEKADAINKENGL